MAQRLRLVGGVDRDQSPARRALPPRSDNQRRSAGSPAGDLSDLDLARRIRANLFVVGDEEVVATLVTSLWQSLATPIVVRNRGESLQLSPASPPAGTIVIVDVDTLTSHEQLALYDWIAGNGRTQVVSTAATFLQPLLETGAFNVGLYYRLYVVTVDLRSHP